MSQPDVNKQLEEIIQEINEAEEPQVSLLSSLKEFRSIDVAEVFPRIKRAEQGVVFATFSDERAAEVLVELDEVLAIELLRDLEPQRIASILNYLPPDEGADVIAMSEEEEQPQILTHVDEDLAEQIRDLATYEPDTAGGLMTSNFVSVGSGEQVRTVLLKVRTSDQAETINYIYSVDEEDRLEGVVSVRELLQAGLSQPVRDIMEVDLITVPPEMDQEEVFRIANKYHLSSLPVIDETGVLKGIITFDDLMEVIEEESSEDMYRMAGESIDHPTQQPVYRRILARFPWLMVTLAGTFLAAAIIRFFETIFRSGSNNESIDSFLDFFTRAFSEISDKWSFLICFVPMIGGMAGNVGLQSSTVMVRGFATGEVEKSDFLKILFKEIIIAAVIGLVSGFIIGGLIHIIFENDNSLGLIVGLSLCSAILSAAVLGTLTPFLCLIIKVDPAYASGPVLTTLNDVFGFLIFFGIALALW